MSDIDVIRAWKDEAYRHSLNETEQALLPDHPSGLIELTETELEVAGGTTAPCWISATTAISALISCWESIGHGTCGGWSLGCCDEPPPV